MSEKNTFLSFAKFYPFLQNLRSSKTLTKKKIPIKQKKFCETIFTEKLKTLGWYVTRLGVIGVNWLCCKGFTPNLKQWRIDSNSSRTLFTLVYTAGYGADGKKYEKRDKKRMKERDILIKKEKESEWGKWKWELFW